MTSRCGLVFPSGGEGTTGAVDLGEFPVSEQDAFRATAVAIPARMESLQGVGGDPTRPGTYQFTTKPPLCTATFTVTSTAPTPRTRQEPCHSPAPTLPCC